MPDALWIAYVAGLIVGLARTDGSPAERVMLALLWPLGPAAFVVTVTGLVVGSLVLFPTIGVVVAGAAVLLWVFLH